MRNARSREDQVGRTKPGVHNLPPETHVYGYAARKDDFGAKDALFDWQCHKASTVDSQPKDFMRLNKGCIKAGGVNSRDIAKYRQTHDERIKKVEGTKPRRQKDPQIEELVFGMRNRPSTPIKNVVCNAYSQTKPVIQPQPSQLKQERQAVLKLLREEAPRSQRQPPPYSVKEDVDFKLKQFKNVPSKVAPLRK